MRNTAILNIAPDQVEGRHQFGLQNGKEKVNPKFSIRNSKSDGFTLFEIIIVIVIISIIGSIASMIILQGVNVYSVQDSRSNVYYQAKFAAERMAREIRLLRSQSDILNANMNPTSIIYTDVRGMQMGFRLNAGNIQRSQDNGTTWQTLATGVTALTFTYLQQDGITPTAVATTLWYIVIDVTDQQGTGTLEIRTRVHPMNF